MNNSTVASTTKPPPQPDETQLWLDYFTYNTPLIILGILIICANGTVLTVYILKRNLKTATNFFLVALAISDLIAGLIGIPTYMTCNISYGSIPYICETNATLQALTSLCTISFIAVITADRYIAIMEPLRYKVLITKKRAKFIIAVVMVISLILSLLPHFYVTEIHNPTAGQRRADLIYTICILLPMVTVFPLMVYAYIRIFMVIRRQHKLEQDHARLRDDESRTTKREIRTVCVFAVMMLAYVFCWAPIAIVRISLYFSNSVGVLPVVAAYIVMALPFVTSLLNPCCYGLGKKDFKSALAETSCCFRSRRRQGRTRRNDTLTTTMNI